MKKFIFSMALVAIAATSNAQGLKASVNAASAKAVNAKVLNARIGTPSMALAPKKTRDDGVFYERPEGLWYSGYSFGTDELSALYCPTLCEFTFVNGCNTPSAATWSINGTDLSSYADEDNNLPWSYSGCDDTEYGYQVYYAPTISYNGTDFSITDLMYVSNTDSPVCDYNSSLCTMYTGFTDGPAWGTGSVLEGAIESQVGSVEAFLGYRKDFEKPISPLYVTSISMPAMSNQEDALGGKELKIEIYKTKVDEKGYTVLDGDPKEVLTCSSIESEYNSNLGAYYASDIQFSKSVVNEFGDEEAAPITIDYPFAIVISGFNQEGVDVELFLLERSGDEFEFDNANPVRVLTQIDGTVYGYYWKGESSGQKYDYAMPFIFNGIYDNIKVSTKAYSQDGSETYDGANYVCVSNDGTTCTNYIFGENYPGAIVATSCPWNDGSDDNYYAEYPDWITGMTAAEMDADNYPCQYIVSFTADALPEGVTGRGAYLHLVGRGVVAEDPIFVYQGDLQTALDNTEDAIENVTVAKNNMKGNFNLAGQKVSDNFKGIVINNGKKFINK